MSMHLKRSIVWMALVALAACNRNADSGTPRVSGQVQATEVQVAPEVGGRILELKVAEGSRVKAGQLLGDIDLADLQSRVADRSASVESAQAALVEAERTHAANVGLSAQNFISSTALQSSQARLEEIFHLA